MDYSAANTRKEFKTEVLLIVMKCPFFYKSSLAFPFRKLLSNSECVAPNTCRITIKICFFISYTNSHVSFATEIKNDWKIKN